MKSIVVEQYYDNNYKKCIALLKSMHNLSDPIDIVCAHVSLLFINKFFYSGKEGKWKIKRSVYIN